MRAMKYTFLIVLMFASFEFAFSQAQTNDSSKSNIRITNISPEGFTVDMYFKNIDFGRKKLNGENYLTMTIDGFGTSTEIGNPQLPVMKRLFELPEGADYSIEIISKSSQKQSLSSSNHYDFVIPVQHSVAKVENPEIIFSLNNEVYKNDRNYSLDLVKIVALGTMRATSLARLEVSPIMYNPISNTIEYTNRIKFRVHISNYDAQKLSYEKQRLYSPFFDVQNRLLINSKVYSANAKSVSNTFPNKYVIIADTMFRESLQPFVRWKEKKGFKVIEAYMQDAGVGTTTTDIKAYLQNIYTNATPNDPAPTYVLFVGDVAQLPAWPSTTGGSHVSDLHYCEFTNDFFPEMMYGRFSANDASELNPQIQKTIEYETYTMADPSFLSRTVLISGYDGSGHASTYGDGQVNYGVAEYFNPTNNTICSSYLFVNSSYDKDVEIFKKINDGVSIANYTAHGAIDGWANPTFKVANIANMTNEGKYPLMIGNACITNHFDTPTCFGEGLMRANKKGAIGYIGASDNTFWDEDYYWAVGYGGIVANPTFASTSSGLYDRMFHTHNEPFSDWAMSSFQYILAGNMTVTQSGSVYIHYYYEIYHVMGDPSLMAYQRVPSPLLANYIPFIAAGTQTFQVFSVPHAMVAISQNDTLISSAISDSNGMALLQLGVNFNVAGVMDIVITAQNYAPYMNTIFGGAPTGPYVISSNIVLDDTASNNNAKAEYGEVVKFDVDYINLTSFLASNMNSELVSSDNQLSILKDTAIIGDINGNDTISRNNAFIIHIDSGAVDGHIAHITIKNVDGAGNSPWISPFTIQIYAPKFAIGGVRIKDTLQAGGNGIIEAGENVIIQIKIENTGSRDAYDVVCNYISSNNKVVVQNNITIDTLIANSSQWLNFEVSFDQSMQVGDYANMVFQYISHAYSGNQNFDQAIGSFDEDFETGDFNKYAWDTITSMPWKIDTAFVYDGMYSMRSAKNMQNSDSSIITLDMRTLSADTLSFYLKVSSEVGYDKVNFFIDGVSKQTWSGNKPWKKSSYFVEAGNHQFRWEYVKDYYMSANMDAVWVDYISFPPTDAWSSIANGDVSIINNISLWPNPATDVVNIEFVSNNRTNIVVSIYNQLGQQIVEDDDFGTYFAGKSTIQVNTSRLKSGVYFVKLTTNGQQYYQKLIIKK